MNRCLLLSGLSGSGKSTFGSWLANKWSWEFIDGDKFGLLEKPKVTLSTGEVVNHWDHETAIDWERWNLEVSEKLKITNVILVTFIPKLEKFTFTIWKHIALLMGIGEEDQCIANRIISKCLDTNEKRKRGEIYVREIAYPEYLRNSAQIKNGIIVVYNDNRTRKPLYEVEAELIKLL